MSNRFDELATPVDTPTIGPPRRVRLPELEWQLPCGSRRLGDRPLVMGIVNVTPDSFSDGGQWATRDAALEHARRLIDDGADIIDLGGESTRPNSTPVSLDEELRRAMPVIEQLRPRTNVLISIDTMKPELARRAAEAGVEVVNDVAGFREPAMREIAALSRVGLVVMHMRGTPQTMQIDPRYGNVTAEVAAYLAAQVAELERAGVARARVVVDPGIGFGKTHEHNLQLCRELDRLHALGRPICFGPSRKGFIGHVLDRRVHERDFGTVATVMAAWLRGVQIMRVHNVAATRDVLRLLEAIGD